MEKKRIEEEKEIKNNIEEVNTKIEDKFNVIKNSCAKNEKSDLLKKLIQENNTKEEYILSYLLFFQNKFNKTEFQEILNKNEFCISDYNYKKYFQQISPRIKNSTDKIIDLISLIKDKDLIKIDDKVNFITKNIFSS